MGKRTLSEEHKRKMAEGRERARLIKANEANEVNEVDEVKEAQPATDLEEKLAKLMARIDQLESEKKEETNPIAAITTKAQMTNAQLTPSGIQGIQYKYSIDKGYYPDPTERLLDEPRLKRWALRDNFILKWDVTGEMYESHNITYAEPRFHVELFKREFDETGELTGRLIFIGRQLQHEDELVTRIVAEKMGLNSLFPDFEDLMSEVRYIRIRQWLIDTFIPEHTKVVKRPMSMVIDGKVVEVSEFEDIIDSATAESKASTIQNETRV